MRFRATVESTGKNTTGIELPADVLSALGGARRPPVRVTLGAHTYRTTVGVMAGRALISVSAAVRQAAAVSAGDEVDVEVVLDDTPRELPVPEDLATLMDPATRAFYDSLSFSRRQRFVLPVTEAKTAPTRARRVEKAITALRERRNEP